MIRRRSWRWLRTRIIGLVSADTRLSRALSPQDDPESAADGRRSRDQAMED